MQADEASEQGEQTHRVRHVSPPVEVPVFNCLVLVAPRNASGMVAARIANLVGLSAEGASEREVLQKLVAAFKDRVAALHATGEPIPWLDPPQTPANGEQQRWIAVHFSDALHTFWCVE